MWALAPILLKPAIPFILFKQGNEVSQEISIILRSKSLFKEQGCYNFFREIARRKLNFDKRREFFMECMWVFGTPCFAVVITIVRDNWVPVTTAWRVLWLRMEERPADMEGS